MQTNRLWGIIGGLIGAVIGVTLHQGNVTPNILTSQKTLVNMTVTLVIAALVGVVVGMVSNAPDISYGNKVLDPATKARASSFIGRFGYVLRTGVFGAFIGFSFAGLIFAQEASPGIDVSSSLLSILLVIVSYVVIGALVGLGAFIWAMIKKDQILDEIDETLLDLNAQVAKAIGIESLSRAALQGVLQAEKWLFGELLRRLNGEEAPREDQQRNETLQVILFVLAFGALGGLVLGAILFYPTLWVIALINKDGSGMVVP